MSWSIKKDNVLRLMAISCGVLLCTAGFCSAARAADKLDELQARFDRDTNAVHRARMLEKLGDVQFAEIRRDFKARNYSAAAIVFEKYRDNARTALDGLKKSHKDAERQSNGYRQLEIHVRRGIREVDETLLLVSDEYKPPLQIVRSDLDAMDRELIRMLFRHPGDQALPTAGAGAKP